MTPFEESIRQRMQDLGIGSWSKLQQQAGMGRRSLDNVRQGHLQSLKLSQLHSLAAALGWSLEQLLFRFHLIHPEDPSLAHEDQQFHGLTQKSSPAAHDYLQQQTFQQLQTLLTQYPTARHMADANPQLPARNLTALFRSLDQLLHTWGIEAIGSPWEQVAFDPALHHPDTTDLGLGETVYIRFVGYRKGTTILSPAKVSRTLPKGYP
ncbi:MAG: helix-turn-helix transcriptional regulator [Synechococcaceae cyanobacterium SM2_3_1]|nr:helix-turn-helix transcriptional regulator [Synechococcaceae cyanobacterium SM2_3_1]